MALRDTLPAEDSLSRKVISSLSLSLFQVSCLGLKICLISTDNLSAVYNTLQNTTIAVVGKGMPFKVMEDDDVQPFLDRITGVPRTGQQSGGDVSL